MIFANDSSFKGRSDLKKYETAKRVKVSLEVQLGGAPRRAFLTRAFIMWQDHIVEIREWYTQKMQSKNTMDQQMATAVFLIVRLLSRMLWLGSSSASSSIVRVV